MRLTCKACALYVPRETSSLLYTLDSSFSLKDLSVYTIYPIVLLLSSLSTSHLIVHIFNLYFINKIKYPNTNKAFKKLRLIIQAYNN